MVILLVLIWLGLVTFGVVAVSASTASKGFLLPYITPKAFKVIVFAIMSLFLSALLFRVPPGLIISNARWVHALFTLTVLLVLVYGKVSHGAQRWLSLGPFGFQPSEFLKLSLALLGAYELTRDPLEPRLKAYLRFTIGFCIPAVFVLLQPDLGTTIVLYFIFSVQLISAGFNPLILVGLSILAGITGVRFLHEYQVKRLLTFLNPYADPYGAGWNVIQSLNAIGSGGLFGKGLFEGRLTNLGFVPERSTDFIMAVIGEELGFIGVSVVALLELGLILTVLRMALELPRPARLYAVGISAYLFIHVFENMAMCVSMMPVTGLTLPFISYGGSSMLMSTLAIALLMRFYLARDELQLAYELSRNTQDSQTSL